MGCFYNVVLFLLVRQLLIAFQNKTLGKKVSCPTLSHRYPALMVARKPGLSKLSSGKRQSTPGTSCHFVTELT